MVTDVLGDNNKYILDCMKDFVSQLGILEVPTVKNLSIVIEQAVSACRELNEHL